MVELNIGILSACLPTYPPLFTRKRGSSNGGLVGDLEKVDTPGSDNVNPSDQSLGPDLAPTRSDPIHSKDFRHIGILGNEHGNGMGEQVEEVDESDSSR